MFDENSKKAAFFYLMGETNSGKSTLMNALAERKVSIVTHKVQTTNIPFYASFSKGDDTIYLLDTPGLFKKDFQTNINIRNLNFYRLYDKRILFIVDANRRNLEMSKGFLKDQLSGKNNEIFLVINKIDKVKKEKLLEIVEDFKEIEDIKEFLMISALNKDGVSDLKEMLYSKTSEDFDYDELNKYTHMSRRFLFSEITREKIYQNVHEEVPYACRVESAISKDRIYQKIFVPKKEYIPILVGKGGAKIKKIGETSRKTISSVVGHNMHLFIEVELDKRASQK